MVQDYGFQEKGQKKLYNAFQEFWKKIGDLFIFINYLAMLQNVLGQNYFNNKNHLLWDVK